jgi:1,4-dihydroxy-2-naphthoate octaprenyltransferase
MRVAVKDWLSAARLRTLPLALSSIIMGGFLAQRAGKFNLIVFLLACLTTILLQVLSNFANDYGDTQNGADLADRVGPTRAVQSGKISLKQMLVGIQLVGIASLFSGILLLYFAFGGFYSYLFWAFGGMGMLCIVAAYTYTAGKKPYGYIGLGDISVFIFFGIVGVAGSYFLYSQTVNSQIILPAISCGALASGVLNINNLRDINSDKTAGKITIPVRIGRANTIIYHWAILAVSILSTLMFINNLENVKPYFYISFVLIILNGVQVAKSSNPDPYLKTLALTSLAHVLLLGFSII